MDESQLCENAIYSEDYCDYILDVGGNVEAARRKYNPACIQIIDGNLIAMYRKKDGGLSFSTFGYGSVPKCYGLLDSSNIEATGAFQVRERPGFSLLGSGVLVGFVDGGIDYTNELFRYTNGKTRILSIWDQTQPDGKRPPGLFYGTVYEREEIDLALESDVPLSVVPVKDTDYHGSFAAAIAVGNVSIQEDFSGMAPGAELIVVKVKEAKKNLRDFYGIEEGVHCYQENDIMLGVRYLWEQSQRLRRPMVIYIGMGTNSGSHSGANVFSAMLNRFSNVSGTVMVTGAGNEGNLGHHFSGILAGQERKEIELNIEKQKNMTVEIWTDSISELRVGVIAPDGDSSGIVTIRQEEQRLDFVFYETKIYVYYERVEYYSGEEVIVLRMFGLEEGIWKIQVYNLSDNENGFHIWMPMERFIDRETKFLQPSPDVIVCNPGNAYQIITAGAYNHRNGSIDINSSRGFTLNGAVKPDFVAPGVEVYGPVSPLSYGFRTGTCIAAAHTTGAAAMLLEWAIVKGNNLAMNTVVAKNYLIRGVTDSIEEAPSKSFGWGYLNIYETFASLREQFR